MDKPKVPRFSREKAVGVGLFAFALGIAEGVRQPGPLVAGDIMEAAIFGTVFALLGGLITGYLQRRKARRQASGPV